MLRAGRELRRFSTAIPLPNEFQKISNPFIGKSIEKKITLKFTVGIFLRAENDGESSQSLEFFGHF